MTPSLSSSKLPSMRHIALLFVAFSLIFPCKAQDHHPKVGDKVDGGTIVSTQQLIRPAGKSLQFDGRPVDLCLSHDGKTAFLKGNRYLTVVDLEKWAVKQELEIGDGGASMHGILATP